MIPCELTLACPECNTGTEVDCFRCHGKGNVCGRPAVETAIGWFCEWHLKNVRLGDKTLGERINEYRE